MSTTTAFELRREPYDGPAATALTAAVQQEYVERYGDPDSAPIDAGQFTPPKGVFVVGFLADEPVAMAGLRRMSDGSPAAGVSTVELKRMFVAGGHRGRGLSRLLLARMEAEAVGLGARRLVLETGQRQPEALALYRSSGYRQIPGYGYYAQSPLSVCMAKDLAPDGTGAAAVSG